MMIIAIVFKNSGDDDAVTGCDEYTPYPSFVPETKTNNYKSFRRLENCGRSWRHKLPIYIRILKKVHIEPLSRASRKT